MKSLKSHTVVTFFMFVSPVVFGCVSGINILSEKHEVYGGTFFNGALDEYHLVGNSPLKGSSVGAFSRAGNFSVMAEAFGDDFTNVKGAYAASSYRFNPRVSDLKLKINGKIWFTLFETGVTCHLRNYTSGQTLYSFNFSGLTAGVDGSGNRRYFCQEQIFSGLDSNGYYELTITARASTGDGGTALLNANISPANIVPLPSSFLLGILGAALARKVSHA